MKNQKIKEAIPLFLVTIILISTLSQVSANQHHEYKDAKDKKEEIPPHYFILAFGACKKVLLNGKENAWWNLEGNLTIFNEYVFGTNENYHILLKDLYGPFGGKTYTKHNLPEKFSLYGFSGWGKIKWMDFPHSPCTYFWLFGTADFMDPEF